MQKIRRKNGMTGCLLWVCFCMTVCGSLVGAAVRLFRSQDILRGRIFAAAVLVLIAAAAVCVYRMAFGGGSAHRAVSRHKAERELRRGRGMTGDILLILLLCGVRAGAAALWGMEPAGDRTLYELAKVTEQGRVPFLEHGASCVYTCLLSGMLLFFGNKGEVVIAAQLGLQTGMILLFFAGIRKLAGRAASVGFMLLASVMPDFMLRYRMLAPDLLLCVLTGAVLLGCAVLFRAVREKKKTRMIALSVLTGALAGVCACLDPAGVVVWLAACLGITQLSQSDDREEPGGGKGAVRKGISAGCLSAGFLAALAAGILIKSKINTVPMPEMTGQYDMDTLALLFLGGLAGIAVIRSFGSIDENTAMITVLLAGVAALRCTGMAQISYGNLENMIWLFAGSIGIQCLAGGYGRKAVSGQAGNETVLHNGPQAGEDGGEKTMTEQNMKQDGADRYGQSSDPGIKYIPNPLPLPKKHVRREIQFDYEPTPKQMEFDLELEDGKDDFDLQ